MGSATSAQSTPTRGRAGESKVHTVGYHVSRSPPAAEKKRAEKCSALQGLISVIDYQYYTACRDRLQVAGKPMQI